MPWILLDGVFTQSSVKHVEITIYFSGLPDVSLHLLDTSDGRGVPKWDSRTVRGLLYYTLRRLLHDPVEALVARHLAFDRLEAWTRIGQVRWTLKWEDPFAHFPQYPGAELADQLRIVRFPRGFYVYIISGPGCEPAGVCVGKARAPSPTITSVAYHSLRGCMFSGS